MMAGIRFCLGQNAATPVVPFPDQLGIARKCGGCGQVLSAALLPESVVAAKCGHTAFRGNSGAGEYGDGSSLLQPFANVVHSLQFGTGLYRVDVEASLSGNTRYVPASGNCITPGLE